MLLFLFFSFSFFFEFCRAEKKKTRRVLSFGVTLGRESSFLFQATEKKKHDISHHRVRLLVWSPVCESAASCALPEFSALLLKRISLDLDMLEHVRSHLTPRQKALYGEPFKTEVACEIPRSSPANFRSKSRGTR